jgi:hypothetical protein
MRQLGFLLCGFSAALMFSLASASVGIALHGAPYASVLMPVATWGLPMAVIFAVACVLVRPSLRSIAVLNALAFAAIAGAVLWPVYAMAQEAGGTTINAGSLFSDVRGTIETVAGVVVFGVLGLLSALVKKNLGLSIDGKMRDTLQSAAMNGVHLGLDKVQSYADTKNLDVKSKIIADGIGYIRQYAPQAVKHFGLGEDDLAAIVKAKLAQLQPAEVAAVAKATGA